VTVEEFIAKWENCPGHERANYAVFLTELCGVLGVEAPGPTDDYRIDAPVPGGAEAGGTGFIDLYKRGCFILEAKQSKQICELPALPGLKDVSTAPSGARYDDLMRRAFRQARRYAQSLTQPPWPPFIIVLDVGRAFEIYFDYGGNGRDYRFFPDRLSYRVPLTALRNPAIQNRLRAIWTDPKSIDPRSHSADVTRQVAASLAQVSKDLEEGTRIRSKLTTEREKAEEIEEAALFLMRILFCMFAEDVGLLPEGKFKEFLRRSEANDALFEEGLRDLWLKMGAANIEPRFAHAVESMVKYFNGGLFKDSPRTFQLSSIDIHHLYEAARQNWKRVEPAIFGTLLEQALSAEERAKLGAHYTPRPYVETLVRATIMDVLEAEWTAIEEEIGGIEESQMRHPRESGGPASLEEQRDSRFRGNDEKGLNLAVAFHRRLSTIRVLDPACGTGNFLYVSMELMQALEARVIETIQTLGGHAEPKVGPHQFYGLEKNPRAAKIAELVLWIGWLRNRLHDDPDSVPQPVLAESANINFGKHGGYDAVLKMNEFGQPDLETPTMPDWPEAEFIVGNPPFIGGKDLRERLGSDYAEALWKANARVPKSADFVMQWWDRAAHTLLAKDSPLIRFGFVTTNSITQEFSRRVIANYLNSSPERGGGPSNEDSMVEGAHAPASQTIEEDAPGPNAGPLHHAASRRGSPPRSGEDCEALSLVMAIPDHPWTKATKDAAAVRIAMTVAERGEHEGELREVVREEALNTDNPVVETAVKIAKIHSTLADDFDPRSLTPLQSNEGICSPGVKVHGPGFIVSEQQAREFGVGKLKGADLHIRPYRNGRDLLGHSRDAWIIDFFGLSERDARQQFSDAYDHILRHVKPERDENRDKEIRENWWVFGRPRPEIRPALADLSRYIATVETAKHRVFEFLDGRILPDNRLIVWGVDDAFILGILSSSFHTAWALRVGGRLEDRPIYTKISAYDPFPFPDATPEQRARIAELAEELDATRKAALTETDKLTMTELYNLREKLRSGALMDEKEQRRATKARAGIVNRLHEQLDSAVADAYGWGEEWRAGLLGPSEIVARLVALNHERAAEEKSGKIRWLRPEYQEPRFGRK
jgi:hypothetical protein